MKKARSIKRQKAKQLRQLEAFQRQQLKHGKVVDDTIAKAIKSKSTKQLETAVKKVATLQPSLPKLSHKKQTTAYTGTVSNTKYQKFTSRKAKIIQPVKTHKRRLKKQREYLDKDTLHQIRVKAGKKAYKTRVFNEMSNALENFEEPSFIPFEEDILAQRDEEILDDLSRELQLGLPTYDPIEALKKKLYEQMDITKETSIAYLIKNIKRKAYPFKINGFEAKKAMLLQILEDNINSTEDYAVLADYYEISSDAMNAEIEKIERSSGRSAIEEVDKGFIQLAYILNVGATEFNMKEIPEAFDDLSYMLGEDNL